MQTAEWSADYQCTLTEPRFGLSLKMGAGAFSWIVGTPPINEYSSRLTGVSVRVTEMSPPVSQRGNRREMCGRRTNLIFYPWTSRLSPRSCIGTDYGIESEPIHGAWLSVAGISRVQRPYRQ